MDSSDPSKFDPLSFSSHVKADIFPERWTEFYRFISFDLDPVTEKAWLIYCTSVY